MRKELDREYVILRKKFLESHPFCKARLKGCLLRSSQVHHTRGRTGAHYLNQDEFLPVCGVCHQFIEDNPTIALELGLSKLRLSNE